MKVHTNYAQFHHRLLAHNVDFVIILFLFFSINWIFPNLNHDFLLIIGVYFSYHIVLEASPFGKTLGKKMLNINIYCENGIKPTVFQIIIRNIAKIVSLLLFFGGFAFILVDRKRRGLHDVIAGTMLIRF